MTPDEIAAVLTLLAATVFLAGIIAVARAKKVGKITVQPEIPKDPLAGDDRADAWGQMPALPSPRQRWTVRRKAAVIEAVRGGWLPIEEVRRLYDISVDEFLNWERDIDCYGVPGLRATRYQIYRDTENSWRGVSDC